MNLPRQAVSESPKIYVNYIFTFSQIYVILYIATTSKYSVIVMLALVKRRTLWLLYHYDYMNMTGCVAAYKSRLRSLVRGFEKSHAFNISNGRD